jgi:hypothetical protein
VTSGHSLATSHKLSYLPAIKPFVIVKPSAIAFLLLTTALAACTVKTKVDTAQIPLQGTWELLSETKIEGTDTTYAAMPPDQRHIKILNATHFSFLRHELKQGKDSTAVFVAGGGSYTLDGNEYHEHLEFCNYREWENHDFDFTVTITNDTLVQQGHEKVEGIADRIIIEKYRRVTN